jgi:hypothetical protein
MSFGRRPFGEVQEQAKAIQRYAKGRGVAICETLHARKGGRGRRSTNLQHCRLKLSIVAFVPEGTRTSPKQPMNRKNQTTTQQQFALKFGESRSYFSPRPSRRIMFCESHDPPEKNKGYREYKLPNWFLHMN